MADIAELQARLAEAETAYHCLMTGALEASVGSGDMQVSYTRANVADLRAYLGDLRRQIAAAQGISRGGCRRLEVVF